MRIAPGPAVSIPMSQSPELSDARQAAAEEFLQEAVYRSRGAQAGKALLAPDAKGQCGLGQEAAVVLDLSPRAEALFLELWPSSPSANEVQRIQAVMTEWIEEQDQLDRKRNHFLKAFRGKHGPKRSEYGTETLRAFESGLEAVNDEVNAARSASAQRLLGGS